MKKIVVASCVSAIILSSCGNSHDKNVIFSCDEYTVYTDKVKQGEFTATVISPTEIVTNYKSPELSGASSLVKFRFSINSRDNEMSSGNHTALIGNPDSDGYVYTFGSTSNEPIYTEVQGQELPKDSKWTIRVDMRDMLTSFKSNGYFVTATSDTIYSDDFKGVWIAGTVAPLTWDFENLYGKHDRKLVDRGDGIFEVTLTVNPTTDVPENLTGWKIEKPDDRFFTYSSPQTIVDATYNMAIECIASNIRPDDTYRAGAAWDGVWTRDVSYSIYLALAYLDPDRAKNSLLAKVKNGRIIQDTGTGGAWPVSSDREVWAMAAWEIYKFTGDKEWLSQAYEIIKASINDDMLIVWNPQYQLMRGEQSYLDWREQTYPRWMQPKDIYESMCLGTNVAFVRAFEVLSMMSEELGIDGSRYATMTETLKNSINNNLWMPDKGYYSEYLYGGIFPIQSPATDNLGQALSIIFDVANEDMAQSIISRTPVVPFGTSSVYPQISGIKPYHNDAVWPFVQAYWNLAAAKAKNEQALNAGLAAIYRASTLFGTHKELFVASNGDYRGTAVNSDKMLWSSTGCVSMIVRIFAGMEFHPDGISFSPFVPSWLTGDKTISNFLYRNSVLNITVKGTGNNIESFMIDSIDCEEYFVPATLDGEHNITITLSNNKIAKQDINMTVQKWMPYTPIVKEIGDTAIITNVEENVKYNLYINGEISEQIDSNAVILPQATNFTQYALAPISTTNGSGFIQRPIEYIPNGSLIMLQAELFATSGTSFIKDKAKARRFVEITTTKNTNLTFTVEIKEAGEYFIDVRYANGSGPINTENKCAIRSLMVNGNYAGPIIMPQRGIDEWLSTGNSNMQCVNLNQGINKISIEYRKPENINMNVDVNTALIDFIRIIKK